MTANQPYLPKPIQPNDTRSFGGFEHEGQIHQPRRIEVRQPVVISTLKKDIAYDFDFSGKLQHSLLITSINADITGDDEVQLSNGNQNYSTTNALIIIQEIDRASGFVLQTTSRFTATNTVYPGELVISPNSLYRLKVNQDLNSIILLGVPVMLEQSVNFLNPSAFDGSVQPSPGR